MTDDQLLDTNPTTSQPTIPLRDSTVELHDSATQRVETIGALLEELERPTPRPSAPPPVFGPEVDNQLVMVRLGVAASLYTALRCRYAMSANHCLRVALTCSTWALRMGLSDEERDVVEVAALLHDVGVIGVPDQILLKPDRLDPDETRIVEQSRRMSGEILAGACADPRIMDIVENVGAWFDGSKGGYRASGEEIPLGARMISIVEAFDSMVTDQVYRRALSQERAMGELFAFAGRQFDPRLVENFALLHAADQHELRQHMARRWLQALDPEAANSYWELNLVPAQLLRHEDDNFFEAKLLDAMHDAVLFIDGRMRIMQWNHGAERLTGIGASSVCQRPWSPSVLKMRDEKGDWLDDEDCPVRAAVESGTQSMRRLTISGRAGRPVSVDCHAMPVSTVNGDTMGAVFLMHDASSETSLEKRCQSLHERATRDPMTQVANRAEFDRVHDIFVETHRQQHVPCSLIICDLDHFKQINDTFGHQAGDDVIRSLASLLRTSCRPGDLVARYGGEEFVMLCADCDNANAARRADQIRRQLMAIRHSRADGRTASASFGVTEIQAGDTPETMLRRADRALLQAKENGRNMVVQLGVGYEEEHREADQRLWWRRGISPPLVFERVLTTPVPAAIAIEKLRGFVSDHRAKILKTTGNQVQLQIDALADAKQRRANDRPLTFWVDLRLEEKRIGRGDRESGDVRGRPLTCIRVTVTPQNSRDRRRADVSTRAQEVLLSLRSYLMADQEESVGGAGAIFGWAAKLFAPWRRR